MTDLVEIEADSTVASAYGAAAVVIYNRSLSTAVFTVKAVHSLRVGVLSEAGGSGASVVFHAQPHIKQHFVGRVFLHFSLCFHLLTAYLLPAAAYGRVEIRMHRAADNQGDADDDVQWVRAVLL